MFDHFYSFVLNFLSDLQHGFIKNRSCVTQLLQILHEIGRNLDNNIQTDVMYLDFAKAFDTVDHGILLSKLTAYGVSGNLFSWFKDYLNGRLQRVVIKGAASDWSPITSGVPQGSILGPLLFVIFINDLPDILPPEVTSALCADDTKVHGTIKSTHDCEIMQSALTNLNNWSNINNIRFKDSKCKVLTVTRKKTPIMFDYYLNVTQLQRVYTEKDLGITITSKLSWSTHIDSIISKANKMLGLLKRTCPLLQDTRVRRTLYLSLVKSQLNYGCEIWSPHEFGSKRKLESVQRRATRWILMCRQGEISYKDRLIKLNLLPLAYDREIRDIVLLFKSMFGFTDCNINNYVSLVSHGRTRLSSSDYLRVPKCKTTTFQGSYFNRTARLWNRICRETSPSSFTSVRSFKTFLFDKYSLLLNSVFDTDFVCTWSLLPSCPCHKY